MTIECTHNWTVTSECPTCLRTELNAAYAELHKIWGGHHVLFDRDVYSRVEAWWKKQLRRGR